MLANSKCCRLFAYLYKMSNGENFVNFAVCEGDPQRGQNRSLNRSHRLDRTTMLAENVVKVREFVFDVGTFNELHVNCNTENLTVDNALLIIKTMVNCLNGLAVQSKSTFDMVKETTRSIWDNIQTLEGKVNNLYLRQEEIMAKLEGNVTFLYDQIGALNHKVDANAQVARMPYADIYAEEVCQPETVMRVDKPEVNVHRTNPVSDLPRTVRVQPKAEVIKTDPTSRGADKIPSKNNNLINCNNVESNFSRYINFNNKGGVARCEDKMDIQYEEDEDNNPVLYALTGGEKRIEFEKIRIVNWTEDELATFLMRCGALFLRNKSEDGSLIYQIWECTEGFDMEQFVNEKVLEMDGAFNGSKMPRFDSIRNVFKLSYSVGQIHLRCVPNTVDRSAVQANCYYKANKAFYYIRPGFYAKRTASPPGRSGVVYSKPKVPQRKIPQKATLQAGQQKPQQRKIGTGPLKCFRCGRIGHRAMYCYATLSPDQVGKGYRAPDATLVGMRDNKGNRGGKGKPRQGFY